jgi:hypothetical protein
MRRAAGALVLLLACLAARPDFPMAPAQEQRAASADSRYVKAILARPFTRDHHATLVAMKELYYSGNEEMSRLLGHAEERRGLATLTGEPFELPKTLGDAIERERTLPPFEAKLREALGRVAIDWASARSPGTPRPEGTVTEVRDGMWTATQYPELTRAWALVRVHNGLEVPVRAVYARIADDDKPYLHLSCEVRSPSDPRALAPGEERVVLCWGDDRTDRIAPALEALAARSMGAPRLFHVETQDARLNDTHVYWEEGREDGSREAFASLSAASCEDKGSCPAIAHAQQARVEKAERERAPSRTFELWAAAVVAVSLLAAVRVKPRGRAGIAITLLALAAIVFAAFAATVVWWALTPRAGLEAMAGFVIVYYGAAPFFLVLMLVGASLAKDPSRLAAFAVTFGVGTTALIVATLGAAR